MMGMKIIWFTTLQALAKVIILFIYLAAINKSHFSKMTQKGWQNAKTTKQKQLQQKLC